jgi:hypothetical protein
MTEIEVIYLKDNMFSGRKFEHYEDNKGEEMYLKVCAKYKDGGAFVIMRRDGDVVKTFLSTINKNP